MIKEYTSLGLMSGTSGDGVDASIIKSDGSTKFEVINDKYFKYDENIYQNIHELKEKINSKEDLEKFSKEIKELERKITIFHAKVIKEISAETKIELIGFHGQTLYHNAKEKISLQIGDGNLLFQLSKKNIVNNFRQNDLKNGGEGAPLTPIFHQLLATQLKLKLPVCFLNIGGISNYTLVDSLTKSLNLFSRDIGPGNCMIDNWVRKNSQKKYDFEGNLASKGKTNEIIFEQAQELFSNKPNQNTFSYDVNDFDISFARGLSLEDGAATLTDFTASIIGETLTSILSNSKIENIKIITCGGGRKNKFLIDKIKKKISLNIDIIPIDKYGINGDFTESQAFAFLAIRSILKLPISFPNTTGCDKPITGGEVIKFK